jgi:nucleotide-binding universal stress UspA family protein
MAKRMLVPLDRSALAESVLPLVADLARGAGATVRLLHVAPSPELRVSDGHVVAYADQEMARLEAEGTDYLQDVAVRLPGVAVEHAVRYGDPVPQILAEAEAFGADLLVVATAGRSGLGRQLLGSVAEQVFRKAAVPVVLFHPAPSAR